MSNNSSVMIYIISLLLFMNTCGAIFTILRNDKTRRAFEREHIYPKSENSKDLEFAAIIVSKPSIIDHIFKTTGRNILLLCLFSFFVADMIHNLIQRPYFVIYLLKPLEAMIGLFR